VNCRKRREWHEGRRTEGGIRGSWVSSNSPWIQVHLCYPVSLKWPSKLFHFSYAKLAVESSMSQSLLVPCATEVQAFWDWWRQCKKGKGTYVPSKINGMPWFLNASLYYLTFVYYFYHSKSSLLFSCPWQAHYISFSLESSVSLTELQNSLHNSCLMTTS
jgi:hypothetical protein